MRICIGWGKERGKLKKRKKGLDARTGKCQSLYLGGLLLVLGTWLGESSIMIIIFVFPSSCIYTYCMIFLKFSKTKIIKIIIKMQTKNHRGRSKQWSVTVKGKESVQRL